MTEDLNRRNDQSNNERLSSVELFMDWPKKLPRTTELFMLLRGLLF
jgi:hypothetical protein